MSAGGSQLAYATMGNGPPLVFPPSSFGHLALELEGEEMHSFFGALASEHTLIRYDRLGTGLSDRQRDPDTFTVEFEVDVLEALVAELGPGRVGLFGFSYGGVVAAAFAARRPEAVRRMLLYGAYGHAGAMSSPALLRSVTGVLRADWELGSRLLAEAFLPGADRETTDAFARIRRESCSGETAAALLELWARTDIRDVLGDITAPTLVLHRREDPVVPVAMARTLAAMVAGARFEMLEGNWHQPWLGDASTVLLRAGEFFGFAPPPRYVEDDRDDRPAVQLTPREREVLSLVAEGLSDATIAQRLVLSAHTVHRHVANIRSRLGQPSRAAAAVHATREGLI